MLDFNVYEEKDLPFLSNKTEIGTTIKDTIIDNDVDDDCQTDEEQKRDAKNMLKNELHQAINKYLQDKKEGTTDTFIKNLDTKKRFSRPPF
jgi:hypothetical protein